MTYAPEQVQYSRLKKGESIPYNTLSNMRAVVVWMIPTPHALRTDVSSVGPDIASRRRKFWCLSRFLSVFLCILPPIEFHLRHNQWQVRQCM